MKREIWENYLNSIQEKRQQTIDMFRDKSNFSKLMSNNCKIFHGNIYYGKFPHSRVFKHENYAIDRKEKYAIDNLLATTNELILQKKYRDLGLMSVEHISRPNEKYYNNNSELDPYAVISQYNFDENTQTTTLADFFNSEKLSLNYLIKTPTTTILKDNMIVDHPAFWYNLENILINKDIYLKNLTQNCYDQIIRIILLSIFEFGDDDHLNNYLLCKKKDSDKFEELCVLDKESTAFCMPIVQDLSFEGIKNYAFNFTGYNICAIDIGNAKSFDERYDVLLKMIIDGKLDRKYYKFLKTIADTNYDNLAHQVYEETGIKPLQQQVDMFKVGSEKAGRLYNLQPFDEDNLKNYYSL